MDSWHPKTLANVHWHNMAKYILMVREWEEEVGEEIQTVSEYRAQKMKREKGNPQHCFERSSGCL